MNLNAMTFAARDFSPRRGTSDAHIPPWIRKERASKSGRKRPAAQRVAPNLACGFVARFELPQDLGRLAPEMRGGFPRLKRNDQRPHHRFADCDQRLLRAPIAEILHAQEFNERLRRT